ncbi:MAG: 4Fe-4S binding protein [Eubacteriales bacterium]
MAIVSNLCVACGTCIRECPLSAISISNGIHATVNKEKCVGCGKCSKICPASVWYSF